MALHGAAREGPTVAHIHIRNPQPVAIITGSTSGIGRASAAALGRRGFALMLHGLDEESSIEAQSVVAECTTLGVPVAYVQADLRDASAAATTIVSRASALWGRIDVVVNNAAMVLNADLETLTENQWDDLLAVNLKAPFFLVQAALDLLEASNGSIIMISSTNALVANRRNLIYDTTKAALNHASLNLALELRDRGIRVNTLMPGGTRTPNLVRWATEYAGGDTEGWAIVEAAAARGSLASPEDIAAAVAVLAVNEVPWMTGATIAVDGGYRLGP